MLLFTRGVRFFFLNSEEEMHFCSTVRLCVIVEREYVKLWLDLGDRG